MRHHCNKHLTWPLLIVGAIGCDVSAQDRAKSDVEQLFARWNHEDTAGAAVAIVQDGEVAFAKGYGMADLERRIAITPSTPFRIASVSKQFTAFAIAMLAEQQVVSLDDDVRDHLPEVPDFGATITLRHLVHHTSGLRDVVELLLISGYHESDARNRQRYWSVIRNQRELNFAPGTDYLYSNTGYFLLAEVVARTTGASFRSWMQEHVFQPLGMDDTYVHDDRAELAPARAHGYEMDGSSRFVHNSSNSGVYGGSGIYSTVEDLATWLQNFESHRVGGDRVLARMVECGQLASGEELTYAFGLSIDTHRGLRRVSHGGRTAGYLSFLAHYPDQRFGVVVLCNAYPMEPLLDPGALCSRIAELYLREHMSPAEEPAAHRFLDSVPAGDLSRLAGWYWHAERNYLRSILARGDQLMFRETSGRTRRLRPLGNDRFLIDGTTRTFVAFEPTGEVPERMTVTGPGGVDVFDAVETPHPPTAEDLQEYAGEYFSPELRVAISMFVRDDQLKVASMGHGEGSLHWIVPDHFNQFSPWWLGYDIHFQRNAATEVVGFRVSNYHAKNIRFDKMVPR